MTQHELTITLFAPSLNREQIAAATELLNHEGVSVKSSEMLRRRETESPACLVSAVTERTLDEPLRKLILDGAEAIGADIFLRESADALASPRLFIFDMDSTLIQAEVIDELAKLAGVQDRVAPITERAMRGEIDFRGALAERVALLQGLELEKVERLNRRIKFSPGVETLMRGLHAAGCITIVVSGGFAFFGRYAQQRLGFKYLFTNELEVSDGALTGKLVGTIVDAQRKRSALLEVAEREGIPLARSVAVGDGANDLLMLGEAGIGVAYRAKPIVRAAAKYRLNVAHLDSLLYLLH